MDRACEIVEYGPDGVEILRDTHVLVDPAIAAADALEQFGASRTGALPYVDRTSAWGPFIRARFEQRTGPSPMAFVWIRETEPPWRSGWGVALRWRAHTTVYGLARRSEMPEGPSKKPIVTKTQAANWNISPGELIGR